MRYLTFFFLPLLLLVSCSEKKEKVLYPTKVLFGETQYDFLYNPNKGNRIYSITTTRSRFYEAVKYTYCDENYKNPDHPLKNYIYSINYEPDKGTTGWDGNDFVIRKSSTLFRLAENPQCLVDEWENKEVYYPETAVTNTREKRYDFIAGDVKHEYNAQKQLISSAYFAEKVITKRVEYSYNQGKLSKASFYDAAAKPYQIIELDYDNNPGYLRNLTLDARFLPIELPYRDHNITSYKVTDGQGKELKDLSYTCSYTYNSEGYPNTFTRKMLDGKILKGYMVYRTEVKGHAPVVAVN